MLRRFPWGLRLAAVVVPLVSLASACSGSDSEISGAGGYHFHGEGPALPGFSFDTGLQPASGPARASLAFTTKGTVTVDADGVATASKLAGRAGSGHLKLDLHLKLAGNLKVDVPGHKYDGDIPGLNDIDVPIAGETAFDPFLLDAAVAKIDAPIPETKLPEIPLGSVPGKLILTIMGGSAVTTSFHGSCLAVHGGQASYAGDVSIGGHLTVKATIKLDLPKPLDKSVDLPDVAIELPSAPVALDLGKVATPGVSDADEGSCAGGGGGPGGNGGDGGSSGSPDGGNPDDEPPADGGACNAITLNGPLVEGEKIIGTAPTATGGTLVQGTYDMFAYRVYGTASSTVLAPLKASVQIGSNVIKLNSTSFNYNANYVVLDKKVILNATCGLGLADSIAYSVVGNVLRLDAPLGSDVHRFEFTRR